MGAIINSSHVITSGQPRWSILGVLVVLEVTTENSGADNAQDFAKLDFTKVLIMDSTKTLFFACIVILFLIGK